MKIRKNGINVILFPGMKNNAQIVVKNTKYR